MVEASAARSVGHAAAWVPALWTSLALLPLLLLVSIVNQLAPEAYMDEPFHVPATQRYCSGDLLTWDPKITTFPGLYVVGAAYAWAARLLAGWAGVGLEASCSTRYLRSANALLLLACMQLMHAVGYELQRRSWRRAALRRWWRQQQEQRRRERLHAEGGGPAPPPLPALEPGPAACAAMRRSALALAAVLSLLPTHFFFGFLYYTDVAALASLLLAQLLLLRRAAGAAAAAAATAVGVRQTNAVWVTLMIGGAVLDDLLGGGLEEGHKASGSGEGDEADAGAGTAAQRQGKGRGGGRGSADAGAAAPPPAPLFDLTLAGADPSALGELLAALPAAWRLRRRLLARYWALLAVPAAFAVFVKVNGGVTVGDREAHAPVMHLAQPLYFGLFLLVAAGPLLLAPAAGGGAAALLTSAARRPAAAAAAAAAAIGGAVLAVRAGTLAHPYLIADNRHYTFYLWRRVVARHWAARYALAPAELLGWALLLRALLAGQRRLWVAAYTAAVAATLLPAWLVEPRYFTPGLVVGLLHAWAPALGRSGSGRGGGGDGGGGAAARAARLNAAAMLATGLGYAAIDAATLYVFLARPFTWPDGSVARFMW